MKNNKIIAGALLAAISATSVFGCFESGNTNVADLDKYNPSTVYYANSTGEYLTYGYHPPTDGSYTIDGETFQTVDENGNPVDFRTQERYEEYLDAGLNLLFIQGNDVYNGYNFETSQLKKNMDNAYAAGISKVSVFDSRLYWPSTLGANSQTETITFGYLKKRDSNFMIPEGKTENDFITDPKCLDSANFAETETDYELLYKSRYDDRAYSELTDEEKDELLEDVTENFNCLVDYFADCIAEYKDHPAFYGVMLIDEPVWFVLRQTCIVARAIREASEKLEIDDMFIQVNLLPMDTQNASGNYSPDKSKSADEQYEEYVDNFCRRSLEKRLGMDVYPMRETKGNTGSEYNVFSKYYSNITILAKIAKKYGCSLAGVAQACELTKDREGNSVSLKKPDKSDMYWQLNSYMGFGFSEIAYYVYWSKQNNANGGYHTDGTMFITHEGKKTDLYYWMQDIHKEMQAFAPIMLNFDYKQCNYFVNGRTTFNTAYVEGCYTKQYDADGKEIMNFEKLFAVTVGESQIAVVTELLDSENSQYMYMLMNPNSPSNSKLGDVGTTSTMKFADEYNAVEVWYKGEMYLYSLNAKHEITFDLSAGYAVYVMPFTV